MTLPIPATYMPNDQLTAAKLNADLKPSQTAAFRPARAKFVRTTTATLASSNQPTVLAFSTGAVYDDAFDGSTMRNASGLGFTINFEGSYRIKARFSLAYLAAATSGFRYLGIYTGFGSFIASGSNIGSALSGIYGDPGALAWDMCRWVNGSICSLYVDITTDLIPGNNVQFGIAQNSSNTLTYVFSAGCIWASCRRVA